ncbi:apolipoprotein N-acyltransferase [Oceaniovalibus guishaninsula]
MAGLGQVPFSLVAVSLAGLAAACLLVCRAPSWRGAALAGWLIGTGHFAITLHWIVQPFFIDIARHGWMAPFALLLCAGGFALFWAAAGALAHVTARSPAARALAFATAIALAELARSHVLTGFPWALVGYVWTETPAAQIASLAGSFGLTWITLLLAAAIAIAVMRGWIAGALAFAGALTLPLGLGLALRPPPAPLPADAPLIRLVQPNVPQAEKWDPSKAPGHFDRMLRLTSAPGADGPPDLIVWPETAVTWRLDPAEPGLARMADAADGTPLAFGVERTDGWRFFNSLAVISDGRIADVYDKHHLVPFGEFIPLGGLPRLIGLRGYDALDGFGFSAGPGPRLLDLGRAGTALPLICYEAIFPQDVAAAPARPDWLLQITNDAWFGTFSGPYMHLAQARMRSIEQGLPMVRVANTGVSALIDVEGRVLAALPLGEAGRIDARLPPPRPPTIYARTGDLPWLAAMIALLAVMVALRWRRRL